MAISRTQAALEQRSNALPRGSTGPMERRIARARNFSVTDSSDSTVAIYVAGLIPYRLTNESGGSITFTVETAHEKDGTAITPHDADSVAVPTMTIADDADEQMSPGLAGCEWLIITGSAAADNITLMCMG